MLLDRLKLTNWGPHKELDLTMGCNIVGVIGANGKGKSNLLQAIDFALNKNLNKQNKTDYIHNFGQENGAKTAKVELWFTKSGKHGYIERTITKQVIKNKLEWDDSTYTADAAVSEVMERILGADKAAMANAIFVKQGDMDKLVKGTPAVRQEIFQKLMNLNFLDAREADIITRIYKLKAGLTDLQPTLDTLTTRKDELSSRVTGWERELTELNDYKAEIDALTDIYKLESKYLTLSRQVDAQLANERSLKSRFKELLQRGGYTDLDKLEKDAREAVLASDEAYEKHRRLASSLEAVKEYNLRKGHILRFEHLAKEKAEVFAAIQDEAVLQETIDQCNTELRTAQQKQNAQCELQNANAALEAAKASYQELAGTIARDSEAYKKDLEKVNDMLTAEREKRTRLRLTIDLMSNVSEAPVCPVCGQSCEPFTAEKLTQLRNEMAQADADIATMDKHKANLDSWFATMPVKLSACTESLLSAQKQHATAEQHVAQYGNTSTRDEGAIRKELQETEQLRNQRRTAVTEYNELVLKRDNEQQLTDRLRNKVDPEWTSLIDKPTGEADLTMWVAEAARAAEAAKQNTARLTDLLDEVRRAHEAFKAANNLRATTDDQMLDAEDEINKHPSLDLFFSIMRPTLTDEDAKYTQTVFELDRIQNVTQTYIEKASDYRNIAQQIDTAKQDIESTEAHIADVVAKMERDTARRTLIDDLGKVRQMVSRGGIPMLYMNTVFRQICGIVQELLQKMQANFVVEPDEERPLTFKFIRTDNASGYAMSQELLSGGQAIRLSLAMLIACQRVILPDVGLLVLDEPSSHVDAAGVESLKEMFLSITSILRNSETQLIIVDHNTALDPAFEQTITL